MFAINCKRWKESDEKKSEPQKWRAHEEEDTISRARESLPAQRRSGKALRRNLFQGDADWKKFVGFATADEAYLVLLDANGEVKWRGHGVLSEEGYATLQRGGQAVDCE